MTQIQQLIDGPADTLAAVRDVWLACGLATGPADRDEAERGVADAYRAAGLTPPHRCIWLDSPMAGAIATWLLVTRRIREDRSSARVGNRYWDQVYAQIRERIDLQFRAHAWDQVRNPVRDQVRHEVWRGVRSQLWTQAEALARTQVTGRLSNHVWSRIRDQVEARVRTLVQSPIQAEVQAQIRNPVAAQIEHQFRSQIGAQPWQRVRTQVLSCVAGQHEAGWLAYHDVFRTYCRLTEVERLAGLMRVARSAGWWWPHRDVCILTERPTVLHRDGQTRLHAEDGPALAYADGFTVWAWHGARIPRSSTRSGLW